MNWVQEGVVLHTGQGLLWWGVSSGGLQDASQHLVVVEWLVLFGGVTGAVIY